MKSRLAFFDYQTHQPSSCGNVLDITFSNEALNWQGIILEKGSSEYFYPKQVYTPYFYFALALDKDLSWSVKADNELIALKTAPGNIWINPPKTPFTHNISEPCYFVILAIEEHVLFDACPYKVEATRLEFLNNYNVEDETIKGLIELLLLETQANGRNGKPYLQNLVSALSAHYIQNYSNYEDVKGNTAANAKFGQSDLAKIDDYIQHNIGNAITIEALADLVFCSKYYFLREFKKSVGETPYQYITHHRIEHSKRLLLTSSLSLSDIAHQMGFNDQSHFNRVFKQHVGLTPKQFTNA
ncbi:helix-turn-helix transcriptional regulator [Alteromonas sp. 009811495]|uniref:helix-turn-helix transcriptional regulator n=1 Tax=Alteromonas sp. 009811495 TaxID=3002962 RepID=UPI00237EB63A|nr:AraC family transcriptional regulator [Alteromonas sp. 009811495]WDT84516.1 AraC family transcriptional regulator [Alteromonas sp. 009811495]